VEINSTVIFEKNYAALNDPALRFVINEGGSRSSKTYSLCQMLIVYCYQNKNKVVSIIRKTFPALRATVMRDFLEIMKDMDIYEVTNHNKSEHIYSFPNGSIVEFFSVDDEQKIRGRKKSLTTIPLNHPPGSMTYLTEESILIKSTYRDNPFLPDSIKKQIEDLEENR
jgi:phage terminase large subunit